MTWEDKWCFHEVAPFVLQGVDLTGQDGNLNRFKPQGIFRCQPVEANPADKRLHYYRVSVLLK